MEEFDLTPPVPRAKPTDDPLFDEFWAFYPRRCAKADAQRAFAKLRATRGLVEQMREAVEWQKTTRAWRQDGGAWIPHPATWLNGHRWLDEPPPLTRHEGEWQCPHTPHCGSRYGCERQQAIEALKRRG